MISEFSYFSIAFKAGLTEPYNMFCHTEHLRFCTQSGFLAFHASNVVFIWHLLIIHFNRKVMDFGFGLSVFIDGLAT